LVILLHLADLLFERLKLGEVGGGDDLVVDMENDEDDFSIPIAVIDAVVGKGRGEADGTKPAIEFLSPDERSLAKTVERATELEHLAGREENAIGRVKKDVVVECAV
jgi:hypothetical protein